MKRVISLIAVFVLCFALAVPAFATSNTFVPSITAKPAPGVQHQGNEGAPAIQVVDSAGEVLFNTTVEDLVITPIADLADKSKLDISDEAAALLQKVYDELTAEGADLAALMPALAEQCEKLGIDINSVVITDLFDLTVKNDEFMAYLAEDGHTMALTLEANVAADYHVFVLVYVDGQWQMIESVTNNGDGTIDCVFEEICPVAILTAPPAAKVEATESATEPATEAPEAEAPAPEATDAENGEAAKGGFNLWWILLLVAAGVVGVVAKNKASKASKEKV